MFRIITVEHALDTAVVKQVKLSESYIDVSKTSSPQQAGMSLAL